MYQNHGIGTDATLSAPPAAVAGATLLGVSLEDWVMIATLIYTAAAFAWLIYKAAKEFRGGGGSGA